MIERMTFFEGLRHHAGRAVGLAVLIGAITVGYEATASATDVIPGTECAGETVQSYLQARVDAYEDRSDGRRPLEAFALEQATEEDLRQCMPQNVAPAPLTAVTATSIPGKLV